MDFQGRLLTTVNLGISSSTISPGRQPLTMLQLSCLSLKPGEVEQGPGKAEEHLPPSWQSRPHHFHRCRSTGGSRAATAALQCPTIPNPPPQSTFPPSFQLLQTHPKPCCWPQLGEGCPCHAQGSSAWVGFGRSPPEDSGSQPNTRRSSIAPKAWLLLPQL